MRKRTLQFTGSLHYCFGAQQSPSRKVAEKLGTLTSASYIFLLAGALSCTYLITSRRFQAIVRAPPAYLFGCGTLFIVYMASLYLAIGTATNRLQVLEVGLVNYLWPSLTLAFAVPILGRKALRHVDPRVSSGVRGRASCFCTVWRVVGSIRRESRDQLVSVHACLRSCSMLGAVLEPNAPLGRRGGERSGASVPSRKRIGTRRVTAPLGGKNPMDNPIRNRARVHGSISFNHWLRIMGYGYAERKHDSCSFSIVSDSAPLDHHRLRIPWSRNRMVSVGRLPTCDCRILHM